MFNVIKLLCVFSLFFSISSVADVLDYPLKQVSEHTYVIHGPLETPSPENRGFMNNPAFIIADQGVIVVDPGSSDEVSEMLLNHIKALTKKPVTHVFNTHIHGDHWLGNDAIKSAWPDAIVYADPRMIKKAKQGEAHGWIELLNRLTEGATEGTEIYYPEQALVDGDQLTIHGLQLRIHSVGIAHSDSDIMIEFVDDSLMFTGDNVAYKRILRMDDASFRDIIKACDRAISLGLEHYVPGHGVSSSVEIVKLQKTYFEIIYGAVGKYYEEGLTDYEMKPMIVKMLSAYKDWADFDAMIGKHISLALLEVEQAEFE
ncbi:MAG: MBL fold metallo-hydrolase [Gammaproteobacteria bacterium]|nr:MBL fold metallo-hydrolase [Gammaproteobacteria bacterium]